MTNCKDLFCLRLQGFDCTVIYTKGRGGKGGGEGLIQFAVCLMHCVLTAHYTSRFKHLDRHGNIFVWSGLPVYYGGPYMVGKGYYAGLLIWQPTLSLPCTSSHLTVPHGDLIWCTKALDESKWGKCYSTLSTILNLSRKDLGLCTLMKPKRNSFPVQNDHKSGTGIHGLKSA